MMILKLAAYFYSPAIYITILFSITFIERQLELHYRLYIEMMMISRILINTLMILPGISLISLSFYFDFL